MSDQWLIKAIDIVFVLLFAFDKLTFIITYLTYDPIMRHTFFFLGAHPKSVIKAVVWLDENTVVSSGEDFCITQWSVSF